MAFSRHFKKSLVWVSKERVMGIEVQEFSSRFGSFILVNWEATKDNEHLFIGTNYREIKKTVRMLSQIIHIRSNIG